MDVPPLAEPFTRWNTSELFQVWGYSDKSCYKTLCTSFCIHYVFISLDSYVRENTSFLSPWIFGWICYTIICIFYLLTLNSTNVSSITAATVLILYLRILQCLFDVGIVCNATITVSSDNWHLLSTGDMLGAIQSVRYTDSNDLQNHFKRQLLFFPFILQMRTLKHSDLITCLKDTAWKGWNRD